MRVGEVEAKAAVESEGGEQRQRGQHAAAAGRRGGRRGWRWRARVTVESKGGGCGEVGGVARAMAGAVGGAR